jgi:YhcN/YlaJ family sporulation lipoprotein
VGGVLKLKKTRKILLMLFVITMIITTVLSGCKPAKKPTPTRYTPPAPKTTPAPVRKPVSETARAERIARNVAKIPEVNKATVVISGSTALVGIDMKAHVQGAHETEVKKKVEKTVRETDKAVKNVSVTADPDLYKRIDNIAKGIAAGRPLSEFTKQIAEILKRITPSA